TDVGAHLVEVAADAAHRPQDVVDPHVDGLDAPDGSRRRTARVPSAIAQGIKADTGGILNQANRANHLADCIDSGVINPASPGC
ncbi:MAG: hypothetical protein LC708_04430, partial [Actinobacteria bacterium]|nr:hypothetical protein [Actinomycetota bacterium]